MGKTNPCNVCSEAQAKYKCPGCLITYCSVSCYKKHKLDGCEKPKTAFAVPSMDKFQTVSSPPEASQSAFVLEDDGVDYVPSKKLHLLRQSDRLRDLLKNHHLQAYLKNINNSSRPDLAMEKAMREPLFIEFADECLRVIQSS
ncbi:unnamed protein product [Calicophoron daubneyi]|uniref:Zinc finger HIT domain-containing protein 3 n=1 Tax=Calicophoron daubneyi TaxID=300641 RepID=A0AAV2TIB1_CALDB